MQNPFKRRPHLYQCTGTWVGLVKGAGTPCHRYFRSVNEALLHYKTLGYTTPQGMLATRCANDAEMAGLGYTVNDSGVFILAQQ